MDGKVVWLIEFMDVVEAKGHKGPFYYGVVPEGLGPTNEIFDALRFSRMEDARMMIGELALVFGATPKEHMFLEE